MKAYGLTKKEKASEYILGVNSIAAQIVSITSMTVLLVPTLEEDMVHLSVCSGNFYKGLLGCYMLCKHNKVLGPATIALPGLD